MAIPFGLRLARIGSLKSTAKIPMGAALVDKSRLVIGWNRSKSSPAVPLWGFNDYDSIHAELSLFANGLVPGPKAKVYIFRATKDGELAPARPCKQCIKFLSTMGVKTIVYSIKDGWVMEKLHGGQERKVFYQIKE